MEPTTIRSADPHGDAAACVAIYAPYVESGATSFEEEPPEEPRFAKRIADIAKTYPWLVAVGVAATGEGRPPEPLPPEP